MPLQTCQVSRDAACPHPWVGRSERTVPIAINCACAEVNCCRVGALDHDGCAALNSAQWYGPRRPRPLGRPTPGAQCRGGKRALCVMDRAGHADRVIYMRKVSPR
jgi:hypothetical protein